MFVLSVEIALVLACTQGHVHNLPFESSALIGQFLNSWRVTFRKHLIRRARSILSSPPYYLLLIETIGNGNFCDPKQWPPIERFNIQCPFLGGFFIRGSTVVGMCDLHVHNVLILCFAMYIYYYRSME